MFTDIDAEEEPTSPIASRDRAQKVREDQSNGAYDPKCHGLYSFREIIGSGPRQLSREDDPKAAGLLATPFETAIDPQSVVEEEIEPAQQPSFMLVGKWQAEN